MALRVLVIAAFVLSCVAMKRRLNDLKEKFLADLEQDEQFVSENRGRMQEQASDSKYIKDILRQFDQLSAREAAEDPSVLLEASYLSQRSTKVKSNSTTPFHDAWAKTLEDDPSMKSKLCDADRLAKINCVHHDPALSYPSNCKEFCGKLAGILEAEENVVGTFPRCAARIDRKSAEDFAKPKLEDDDFGCWMTPFSKFGFFKFWDMYQKDAVILVMGQGLNPDGSTPPVLKRRAVKAAELYRKHQIPVIVSGGDDRATGSTEAMPLARVMYEEGVPYEAIIYEGQATTTLENFWFGFRQIRRFMHPKKKIKIMLVTSDWHMPRASYFGKVAAYYFKNVDKRNGTPDFFNDMNIKIEEVSVKSNCAQDPDFSGSDVIGSNKQSFVNKCSGEANALANHMSGPERLSVGPDSVDNNVWGVYLDPLENVLQDHRDRINKLKKWTESHKCTALPDVEKGETTPDELLSSPKSGLRRGVPSAGAMLALLMFFPTLLQ